MQNNKGLLKNAIGLNLFFLLIISIVLWLTNNSFLIAKYVYAYGILWISLFVLMSILAILGRFNFDEESSFSKYVIFNTIVSSTLLISWSIFNVFYINIACEDQKTIIDFVLYFIGILATYSSYALVSTFYNGRIYKKFGFPVSILSYLILIFIPSDIFNNFILSIF